ncbi:Mitochondrial fission protein ELM1 [Glycine max]|nr:Mitochondrial fission protein ELM1 [Glycine max]
MFGNFTGQKIYLFTFICLLNNYQILIVKELGNNPKVYIWDGQEPNPQMGHLAWADAFVVTTDSVNMISEACSTGNQFCSSHRKPVYVMEAERCRWKLTEFHKSLRERVVLK